MPLVGVLALQGDFAAHARVLTGLGAEVREVRVPADLEGLDGLVIPGGESTTMSLGIEREGLAEPLRELGRAGTPVLGTCAGMIMLADRIEAGIADQQTLGGLDVVVRRNAFGRQVDSFESDVVFAGLADPFHALFIRAPWVEKIGTDVEVLGTVAAGPAAGKIVAVRQGNVMATSFHPEITDDDRVHCYFADLVRQA